ncbi:MAG: thymidine phosphorylase [Candidatus Bipolaricaulota bacterium]|nr:thymidine phosphorylase [Candidatus Bipolaricaulota bacterium]MBS3791154.1 thymidine phosphorylase [Candidatus Bipolaricaulota bacterium]
MNFLDTLVKKRNGEKLSPPEIDRLVKDYVAGEVPDYQMSAFLMAVYFNSLDREETAKLTTSMANSGKQLDLSSVDGIKVDKHSSGGVGDSVSLVLVPLVGAVGLKIGKLSGRGLGHTGGTIDKLESIPGFRVSLDTREFLTGMEKDGMAIMEHTSDLVPADQKLYELRDVTGTVESLPLIVSSIMSKKIACGPDGLVLDIKSGAGAIMKELERARELAQGCVDIGKEVGLTVTALITDMNQPLGRAVGNSLEVREAIKVLKDETSGELREVTVNLVAELLLQSGKVDSIEEGVEFAEDKLASGLALEKFERLIKNQGGNPEIIEDPSLLPTSENRVDVKLDGEGYVSGLDALKIGRAANILGAGRQEKGEKIDHAVGIEIEKKIGDEVPSSGRVATIHYNDDSNLEEAKPLVREAFTLTPSRTAKPELIKERIR